MGIYYYHEIRIKSDNLVNKKKVIEALTSVIEKNVGNNGDVNSHLVDGGDGFINVDCYGVMDRETMSYMEFWTKLFVVGEVSIELHSVTTDGFFETLCMRIENGEITKVLDEDGIAISDVEMAFVAGDALRGNAKAKKTLSNMLGRLEQTAECVECLAEILGVAEILERLEVTPSKEALKGWKSVAAFLDGIDWDDVGIYDEDGVMETTSWLQAQCLKAGKSVSGTGGSRAAKTI